MALAKGLLRTVCTLAMASVVAFSSGAFAQEELSDAHRQAAREAIRALGATDQFDAILPQAAANLKRTLIQATPNFEEAISTTVDEVALELASRRADLEREAADIYARNFTEEELNAIAEFYTSGPGEKLLTNGAIVTRELLRAAEIWANGISRDLAVETDKALEASLGTGAPSAEETGAAQQGAPAAEAPAPAAQQ